MGMQHGTVRLILLIVLCLIPIFGPPLAIFMVMGMSAARIWYLIVFIVDVALIGTSFGLSGIWNGLTNLSLDITFFTKAGLPYFVAFALALFVVYKENKGQAFEKSILSTGKSINSSNQSSARRQARRQRQAKAEMLASESASEGEGFGSAMSESEEEEGRDLVDDVRDRRAGAAERMREAARQSYAAPGRGGSGR